MLDNFARDLPPFYSFIVRHSDLATLTWAPVVVRFPWDIRLGHTCKANITVAGDAMQPMAPDLGQNECAALEDGVMLGQQFVNRIFIKRDLCLQW